MERKSMRVAIGVVLVSALASGVIGAGAASAAHTVTVAQANAEYANSLAQAKASFLVAVRPSRQTMVDEGKRAEVVRRTAVKVALSKFDSILAREKLNSLSNEKAYKAAVAKLATNPTSVAFKATVKTSLTALTAATTALSTDAKIAAARVVFANARTAAMNKFKANLEISATERTRTLNRASGRYKADEARALATLQIALKTATK